MSLFIASSKLVSSLKKKIILLIRQYKEILNNQDSNPLWLSLRCKQSLSCACIYSLNHTHLEYLESRFLKRTKAKPLSKAEGGGGLLYPFFLGLRLLTLGFYLKPLCLNLGLDISIYFWLCLTVQNHLKETSELGIVEHTCNRSS